MDDTLIQKIQSDMIGELNNMQMIKLQIVLKNAFKSVIITKVDDNMKVEDTEENYRLLDLFIASKKVEGCSIRTLKYYKETIEKMIMDTNYSVKEITTEILRTYLSEYREKSNLSTVTIDNVRRILSSFFCWLENEDYIVKSPIRRIHKIKTPKVVKETFSDENIEKMRDNCTELRNLVLVEMLSSTGMRVGELVRLNREDIDFENRSCVVLGKGNSEREVYFDAKVKLHLREYINSRYDDEEALFVSMKKPHQRLSISGIELILRKLGKKAEINRVYPHKFRRTLATMAIDKGMPIEQVQKLLGHVKIDTTMHYAMVNQTNVKISHRKYIG